MIVLILFIIVWYGYGLVQRDWVGSSGTFIATPDYASRFTLIDGPAERTGSCRVRFHITVVRQAKPGSPGHEITDMPLLRYAFNQIDCQFLRFYYCE